MRSAERRKENVLQTKCLRSLEGVSRIDRFKNEEVHRNGVGRQSGSESIEMVWTVERMDGYCMARRVLMAEVSGVRERGRPMLGQMAGVKDALVSTGMTMEIAWQYQKIGRSGSPGEHVDH